MTGEFGPVVLRAVAAPPRLLHAAPKLVLAEAGAAIGIWLVFLEPLAAIVAFLVLHAAAVVLTGRDPNIVEVQQARLRCRRTRNLRPVEGHRYVP